MLVTEGHRPLEAEYKIWIPNPMKHRGRVFEVSKTTLDKETGRGGRAGVAQSATLRYVVLSRDVHNALYSHHLHTRND